MSTTTTSAATAISSDAQTWIYPPAGAAYPPLAATASFGPVYQGDSMIMEWTPSTRPETLMTCFSQSQRTYILIGFCPSRKSYTNQVLRANNNQACERRHTDNSVQLYFLHHSLTEQCLGSHILSLLFQPLNPGQHSYMGIHKHSIS
jgi:hypothetical protein